MEKVGPSSGWGTGRRGRSWRRSTGRGASRTAIALILVAITVVLVAVLYFVFLHYYGTIPAPTNSVQFRGLGSWNVGASYFDNFTLTITGTVVTSNIGLKIVTPGGVAVSPGSAVGACPGSVVSQCRASSTGWIAVLATANGTVLTTYDAELWPTTLNIQSSDLLLLLSPYRFVSTGDTLAVFATAGSPVTGSVTL